MSTPLFPALFLGHGSPLNAIEDNAFSCAWHEAAQNLPRPKAILCISAHWETHGIQVTAMQTPRTIYDFYGFPPELYAKQYPAPGSPWLAGRAGEVLSGEDVALDQSWGLDHGTWSVLCRMYPEADIPVVQFSLDRSRDFEAHYALGHALLPLRDEGVLIVASGNMVHNLRTVVFEDRAFDWAEEYDANLRDWILAGDHDAVIHYERHGRPAALAVNSGEHYLPLLYILGLKQKGDPVSFFAEKVSYGSLSMRCVQVG